MKASRALVASGLAASWVWLACVGDDPGAGAGEGGFGQPCFEDGTCGPGLACIAGRCRTGADGGPPTDSDGAPGEAGSGSTPGEAGDGDAANDGGVDPVFGTSTFSWSDPGIRANGAGGANHPGGVASTNCVTAGCHSDGSSPFLFGGTVYLEATPSVPASRAEVRIAAPDGKEVARAFTDVDGNFWVAKGATTIPAGARVGVRTAAGARIQRSTIGTTNGGCGAASGGCHGIPPTGRIVAP